MYGAWRMRADDDVDFGVEPVDDVRDLGPPGFWQRSTFVNPPAEGGGGSGSALVEQEHDRLGAPLLQPGTSVDGVRLVEEVEPGDAGGVTISGVP